MELKLDHAVTIHPSSCSGYVAEFQDLPGCVTQADTLEELLPMIQDAYDSWVKVILAQGNAVPQPRGLRQGELKSIVKLLELASEEYSNHGCNDFDLIRDGGLSLREARQVMAVLVAMPGYGHHDADDTLTSDWLLMQALADLIKPFIIAQTQNAVVTPLRVP